jgi:hypothetical protein
MNFDVFFLAVWLLGTLFMDVISTILSKFQENSSAVGLNLEESSLEAVKSGCIIRVLLLVELMKCGNEKNVLENRDFLRKSSDVFRK